MTRPIKPNLHAMGYNHAGTHARNFVDRTGKSYPSKRGPLVALRQGPNATTLTRWWVRCESGHESLAYGNRLSAGTANCPECLAAEKAVA